MEALEKNGGPDTTRATASETITATDSEYITAGADRARRNIGRPPAALPWARERQTACPCNCASRPGYPDPECKRFVRDFGALYRDTVAERRLEDGRLSGQFEPRPLTADELAVLGPDAAAAWLRGDKWAAITGVFIADGGGVRVISLAEARRHAA